MSTPGNDAIRPVTKIGNRERRLTVDMPHQRSDVLADVMIADAGMKVLGALLVVGERHRRNLFQFIWFNVFVLHAQCRRWQNLCLAHQNLAAR